MKEEGAKYQNRGQEKEKLPIQNEPRGCKGMIPIHMPNDNQGEGQHILSIQTKYELQTLQLRQRGNPRTHWKYAKEQRT